MTEPAGDGEEREVAVSEETSECGRVWGFHREHYCVEPAGHDQEADAVEVHYCECDDEAYEHDIVRQEAEERDAREARAKQIREGGFRG